MAISSDVTNPTPAELRQLMLDDLEIEALALDMPSPPVGPGSDWAFLATAVSNQVAVGIERIQILDNDANPLTAEGEPLNEALRRVGAPLGVASVASGQITLNVSGTGSILAGVEFQVGGMKGKISRDYMRVTTSTVVCEAEMLATGEAGNLPVGKKVRLQNQPPNFATEAVVSKAFTGGSKDESDDRKRDRLLVALSTPAGGGNWSQFWKVAMETTLAISHCGVYPALGGPASCKVALASNTNTGTRVVSEAVVESVRVRYAETFPTEQVAIRVCSVLDQFVDVALGLRLPPSGSGVWLAFGLTVPAVVDGSFTDRISIAAVSGSVVPRVAVGDKIAIYNGADNTISTANVLSFVNATTTTVAYVDVWTGGYSPTVGDFVFPAFEDMDATLEQWLKSMRRLGPGEMLSGSDSRFGLAYRHPDQTSGSPLEITSRQTGDLTAAVLNIINAQYLYLSQSTPSVPALVSDQPYCLCLRKWGAYPI